MSKSTSETAVVGVVEALALFRRGELGPTALLERILTRIDRREPELGAYVSVDRAGARRAARAADRAWAAGRPGALCGVPLSVKDLFDVEGMVTGCGNPRRMQRAPAPVDADAVRRLRAAGAVVTGKVHLHEHALGITGENPRLGTPRHPLDGTRLPGGSSSGSAVSVAAGTAVASLATDTGGSVRVPAALCGVVGFKPSFGAIGTEGLFPLAPSMDHVGVICRRVEDAGALFEVLRDGRDRARVKAGPPTLGLVHELHRRSDEAVQAALDRAFERLAAKGISVERVGLPDLDEARQIYTTILLYEAAAALGGELPHCAAELQQLLRQGAAISARSYQQALTGRLAFLEGCQQALDQVTCLAAPATLVPAPRRGARELRVQGRRLGLREALITCTCPFSLVGLPAITLPAGAAAGLPVGLQLVGPPEGDRPLLSTAAAVERILDGAEQPSTTTGSGP